jgi:hypothetical protein
MRFMVMHKVNESMEAGDKPSAQLIAQMGQLVSAGFASGLVIDAAGLKSTATRVRLTFARGTCTRTQGPLTGAHEPMAGFAMIKVKDTDEAIAWSTRLAQLLGDVQIELGPVNEPWDIGAMSKPDGEQPARFLLMYKSGTGAPLPLPAAAKLAPLLSEMKQAGVLISLEALEPSARGTRLHCKAGKRSLVDGPFAESKELIAGYCMLRIDSKQAALDWAWRYAEIIGDVEIDVRPLTESV